MPFSQHQYTTLTVPNCAAGAEVLRPLGDDLQRRLAGGEVWHVCSSFALPAADPTGDGRRYDITFILKCVTTREERD